MVLFIKLVIDFINDFTFLIFKGIVVGGEFGVLLTVNKRYA